MAYKTCIQNHSLQSLQTNLLDNIHLIAQYFPPHAVLEASPKAQQKSGYKHSLVVVVFLNVVADFVGHIANHQLYLLLAVQQLLFVVLELPPAFLCEVMELARHFCPNLAVGVVKPLPVSDQCKAIMPLDMIKLATSVYYSYLLVLLFIFFEPFIDAVTSWDITEFQCALSRDKSAEDGLILMQTSEIGEEDKVGKVVGNCEIEDVGDDCVADEQIFGQLSEPGHLKQSNEKDQSTGEVDVEDDVARTHWFQGVCEGHVLGDDWSVSDIDLLWVLIRQLV